ncbi:MAG TPA: M48 family metalloprotease [Candidatus Acidoferrales bacterium]|nr:M48 family metalloprotease [Candidatus Acidoferrales bacterium]
MAGKMLWAASWLGAAAVAQQQSVYSIEKESALGRQLAAEFRGRTESVESSAALAYVSAIGQRLVAETKGPPWTYRFALIADDPTAMHEPAAFPGGFVFVPASLILAAREEGELAGMLAHAIAHVAARDGTRSPPRPEAGAPLRTPLIFRGAWTGYASPRGSAPALPIGMLELLRQFELEADRMATRVMSDAGWNPEALARYIEREQPADEGASKAWSALPSLSRRVDALREAIAGMPSRAYVRHEGLQSVQQEIRGLLRSGKTPPALRR